MLECGTYQTRLKRRTVAMALLRVILLAMQLVIVPILGTVPFTVIVALIVVSTFRLPFELLKLKACVPLA